MLCLFLSIFAAQELLIVVYLNKPAQFHEISQHPQITEPSF